MLSKKQYDLNFVNSLIECLGTKGSFAGIGSRRISSKYSKALSKLVFYLTLMGRKVNSGRADGSDLAAEIGALAAINFLEKLSNKKISRNAVMNIFLPWNNFNGACFGDGYVHISEDIQKKTDIITSKYHPNYANLKQSHKKLMGRNANQIFGKFLNEQVKFVLCYTSDAAYSSEMTSNKTGGTGQAIRIADDNNINVFNIANKEHFERLRVWTNKIKNELTEKIGADPEVFFDEYIEHFYTVKFQNNDLIEMAKKGDIDVLIHGCNCQNTKGSGFAKQLFNEFPEAYWADNQTIKGDKRKLGTYTAAEVERNGKKFTIINAYTQLLWGRDENKLYCDYEAIRKVLKAIAQDYPSRKFFMPKMGSGLANGCWRTIDNIINNELDNVTIIVKDNLKKNSLDHVFDENILYPMKFDNEKVWFFSAKDYFSQWYLSDFEENGIRFKNNEQYMMYHKAKIMNDEDIANKIINSNDADPKIMKKYGRLVKNWNQEIWDKNKEQIVTNANILKFSQNIELLTKLLTVGDRLIVEASKYDKIWGCGIAKDDKRIHEIHAWPGQNKLGIAIKNARGYILKNYKSFNAEIQNIVLQYISHEKNKVLYEDNCEQQKLF